MTLVTYKHAIYLYKNSFAKHVSTPGQCEGVYWGKEEIE